MTELSKTTYVDKIYPLYFEGIPCYSDYAANTLKTISYDFCGSERYNQKESQAHYVAEFLYRELVAVRYEQILNYIENAIETNEIIRLNSICYKNTFPIYILIKYRNGIIKVY